MDKQITSIIVRTVFKGTHNWDNCNIPDVMFLQNEHHHEFNIEVKLQVFHNDRDIEFIMMQRFLDQWLKEKYPQGQLGSSSCEMLAIEIRDAVLKKYGFSDRKCNVSVFEDQHYGAIVEPILCNCTE